MAIFAILGLIAIQVFILLPGWLSRSESGVAPEATGAPPTAVLDARSIDARPQKEGEAAVIVATDPPFSAQELRDRAYLAAAAGDWEQARGLAAKAIELAPQNAGGYVSLAQALLARDRTEEAMIATRTVPDLTAFRRIPRRAGDVRAEGETA